MTDPDRVRVCVRRCRRLVPALVLVLLVSACASGSKTGRADCTEATLPGPWTSVQTGNIWTFHPDGRLSCDGPCRFTATTGDPVSWAYEPGANVWADPIDYVKLEFTKVTFQGVFGAFRCVTEDNARMLRLESEDDAPMVFVRP